MQASFATKMGQRRRLQGWGISLVYALAALILGITLPRFEHFVLPDLVSSMSASAAMSVCSAIASGMIALTGIVFSLTFVMVQFSATAYSPRLVLWVARDRTMAHALGVFSATFLYALLLLGWVDRGASGKVPLISGWLVIGLLLASMGMFIALIERIGMLQINRMLIFTGERGRKAIEDMYFSGGAETASPVARALDDSDVAQTVTHVGPPQVIQAVSPSRFTNGVTMPPIIPRWEWRTFDTGLRRAEAMLARNRSGADHESDELYFLSPTGENVKVRDGLMDIKVLREVNSDGLEQWSPVMKAGFPLPAAEAKKVFEALRVEKAPVARENWTLEQFVADVAGLAKPIRAVKVHKLRRRATIGKCMAEFSDVAAEGRRALTIAVEGEDAAAVIAVVRELGLGGWVNTSYPKGLAAMIEDKPARYAVIDVGTNSIKFHLAERGAGGKWRTVADRAEVTRLGEGLEASGRISSEAADRAVSAIAAMAEEARKQGSTALMAVGTAGLRIASNARDVLAAIHGRTGLGVEVISGEEEGRLAYVGVQSGLDLGQGSLVVFDTGGGSSQFTFGQGSRVDERFSVDVGAVRYTERFGLADAVTPDVLAKALAAVSADLSKIAGRKKPDRLVGMGGAVTNIAAVKHGLAKYDPAVIQGSVLDRAEIDRQIELFRSKNADARRAIVGLQPKRAEVILAGACIVRTIMEKLGQERFTVSDRGLRHGVLAERLGGLTDRP
jgi:exopolyphosphatase/guanosine-5'-triphosphate,3'-diphosphate pyrophosphatase